MRKIFFLLVLFCGPCSLVTSASLTQTGAMVEPLCYSASEKVLIHLASAATRHFKAKGFLAGIRRTLFKKSASRYNTIVDKETPPWKKVLSVVALSLGGLTAVLFFAAPGVLAFSAAASSVVTGIIASTNNHSKRHRNMAACGIVIGIVFPLSAIAMAHIMSNMFSGMFLF